MNTLFPISPQFPEGFSYVPQFISEAEEANLISTIQHLELSAFVFQGYEAKRRVASFGVDWSFEHQKLKRGKPFPHAFLPLVQKVATHLSLEVSSISELLVTEYPQNSVINWHRDAPPFDLIAGISLLSDCVFKLRPYQSEKKKRNSVISIPVQTRSLYVMQGPARTAYQHSIAAVPKLRYSITLRTLYRPSY
jgi:alkylated DNA repair dioxygenase AlkB